MSRFFEQHFLIPLIIALANEWAYQPSLTVNDIDFMCGYVKRAFSRFPLVFKFIFLIFIIVFLFFCVLQFGHSFVRLQPSEAKNYIRKWRLSKLPGASDFIQLFENLIALPLYASKADKNGL